ncbi:hypothetical protein JCM3765_007387 [Sporobolomyces pararoseus]
MSDSPSVATLQSLLRSNTTESAPSSTSSQTGSTDLSPSSTTSYARAYTSPGYWGSTISSAFGYGARETREEEAGKKRVSGEVKGKRKARGEIPSWTEEGTQDTSGGNVKEGNEELSKQERESVEDDDKELEVLLNSILWQAGTDASPNPNESSSKGILLVLACSRIPESSDSFPHVKLLEKLRNRLENFASTGSYSIVLLANPTPHPPSTPQLVSSYLALSRTTRKNLRKLWVVGGGWWTRVILTLFSTTLLSLKVSKKQKIVQCANLSALAIELGTKSFTAIEFPLEVYSENAKLEKEIRLPERDEKLQPVFDTSLQLLCSSNDDRLPPILEDCLEVLQSQDPTSLGIFRRSPSASTVKILEQAYSRHHPVSLSTYPDAPYLAASLLKLFLRSLPDPILPRDISKVSENCPLPPASPPESISYIQTNVLPLLETRKAEMNVLKRIVKVLHEISKKSEENLMTSSNLVICLAPALIGGLVGGTAEEIKTIRVPGMVDMSGTVKGVPSSQSSNKGTNTVGGVLKIMIEKQDPLPVAQSTLLQLDRPLRHLQHVIKQ